jgi:15,16-dihydrobiliverdin:ferredoxin oxidoreductase
MTYFDAGSKVQVFNCLWYPRYHLDAPVLGVDLMCFGNKAVLAVVDCQPLGGRAAATAIAPGSEAAAAASSSRSRSAAASPFAAVRASYPRLQGQMSSRYYDANQFFSDHMLFGRFEHPGAALVAAAAAGAAGAEGAPAKAGAAAVDWAPLLASHPIQADLLPAFQQYCGAYLELVAGVAAAPAAAACAEQAAVEARVEAQQRAYDQYSANRDPAHALFKTYFGDAFADAYMHRFLFAHSDPAATAAYHAAAKARAPAATTGGGNPHGGGGGKNPFA